MPPSAVTSSWKAANLTNEGGDALSLDGADIKGGAFLDRVSRDRRGAGRPAPPSAASSTCTGQISPTKAEMR